MTPTNEPNETGALIAELRQAGIKHSPEQIVRIARTPDGKIVFLETGNLDAGLEHILKNHALEFLELGISPEELPDAIIIAIVEGQIIGFQGKSNKRPRAIYQFDFKGETKYMAVQVSTNGYIVSANPRSYP